MATTVGALSVDLRANSAAFAADMGKARRAVDSSATRMNRGLAALDRGFAGLTRRISAFAVGIAAGVGVGGLALLTKRSIESADAIGKAADKVGLGVEALQEYRFAAEQTGVAQKTLDMAMQRFSRRVGEAARGQGELRDTLKAYNIDVVDAQGKARALEDVLDDYADAVANASSQQEQLRLSFKAFDSEGAALVNLMRRGSAGVAELRQEARNLGIVLDESMVRQAEAANDQLERMKRIVGVAFQRVFLQLAPSIEQLGLAFARAAPKISAFVDRIIKAVIGVDALGLQGLQRELKSLDATLVGMMMSREDLKTLTDEELAQRKEELLALRDQRDELERLIATREKEAAARAALFKAPVAQTSTGAAGDTAEVRSARRLAEATDDTTDAAKRNKAAFDEAGSAAARAFGEAVLEGEKLRDVVRNLANDLLRLLTRQFVTNPLGDFLSAAAGSFFTGGAGPVPDAAAAGIPGGGFAHGGQFTVQGRGGTDANRVSMDLTRGERVTVETAAQQRRGAGSGGGTVNNFVVDMRGASVEAVARLERMVDRINGSIEQRAVDAVVDVQRRGLA
jgi:predicted  nucleic acid-binding Zn-ribbon protein